MMMMMFALSIFSWRRRIVFHGRSALLDDCLSIGTRSLHTLRTGATTTTTTDRAARRDSQKRIAGWLAHGPKEQQRLGIRLFTLLYAYSKPCWRAKFRCAMTTVETNSTLFVCQTKVHVEQWPLIVSQDLHRNFQKNCNATTSKRGTFIFFATARVTCYLNEWERLPPRNICNDELTIATMETK